MAAWHVEFAIVHRSALVGESRLTPARLATTPWWRAQSIPPDYRARLAELAPLTSRTPELETWGAEEGNRVEASLEAGSLVRLVARVDVRKLDARFGAALLAFVRAVGAVLVRSDGFVVDSTIGAFGAALRNSAAWTHANDPATWLANRPADETEE